MRWILHLFSQSEKSIVTVIVIVVLVLCAKRRES
jgi:hypothetical protein